MNAVENTDSASHVLVKVLPLLENAIVSLHKFLHGFNPSPIDLHRYEALKHVYEVYALYYPTTTLSEYMDLIRVNYQLLSITLDSL